MLQQEQYNQFMSVFSSSPIDYKYYLENSIVQSYVNDCYEKYNSEEYKEIIRTKSDSFFIPCLLSKEGMFKYKNVSYLKIYYSETVIYLKDFNDNRYVKKFNSHEDLRDFIINMTPPITPKTLTQFKYVPNNYR